VEGAELFVSAQTRARLAEHLRKVAVLAGALGAGACVYGSPRSRDPGSLPIGTARDIATEFLASVAGAFEAEGTRLAFEANDPSYGCRFITRTAEAIDLVSRVDRPGIRVQIDTGTVFLGHEDVAIIGEAVCLAGHVHASEPWLRPLASANSGHRAVAAALTGKGYDGWISVEMRESKDWRENMERAAQVARAVYRPPLGRAP
jgi:sugar phosphate isomerase/epimerase